MNLEAAMGVYMVDGPRPGPGRGRGRGGGGGHTIGHAQEDLSVCLGRGGPFVVAFDADTPCVTDPLGAD